MEDEARQVLEAALGWDRARIVGTKARNPRIDVSAYEARQARAEAAVRLPRDQWTQEIREHFRALLEVLGDIRMAPRADRPPVEVVGGSRLRRMPRVPEAITREGVIAAAREIGELPILQTAGSAAWRGTA